MKTHALAAAALGAALLVGCNQTPVANVPIPSPNDPNAYQPMVAPKPLAPNGTIVGSVPPAPPPPAPPAPGGPGAMAPGIENEDAFVAAYAKAHPRIMIFVNRTIQGDPIPHDQMETFLQKEQTQSSTGAVQVASNDNNTGNGQASTVFFGGQSGSASSTAQNSAKSFTSSGPATYNDTTYWKRPADKTDAFGASNADYTLIESSLVEYFDESGRVNVQDADAAREKLTRAQVLRIENADPQAADLLKSELGTDVLIRVSAAPTTQSAMGPAIRLIATAVDTGDTRVLGNASVDMQLPMTKENVNVYTRYLASKLMGQMANKWNAQP